MGTEIWGEIHIADFLKDNWPGVLKMSDHERQKVPISSFRLESRHML